ncbi:NUDIX domain-containing protein [Streptomyces sp. BE20]|uniref:NUDIX hydrolase n=1 Tax=Streptomyces sp. BE20 TaxID=3002525 RepID=UPI002E781D6E|nr:NUDIX domain-containing protein [Streptomyces sp. BE20]MEE1828695.1 NUDIX domain-containing protein [Streptomyces sp. BE20]
MTTPPDTPGRTAAEQEWLASYDPRAYTPVAVTVDVVALTLRHGCLHVLLVERALPPYQGRWALPGGFLRAGEESLDEAAARELAEETGLHGTVEAAAALSRIHLEQLGTYGAPDRDPRMHVVGVAYLAFAPDLPDPQAGTDAARAAWHPVTDLDLRPPGRSETAGAPADTHGGGVGRCTGTHIRATETAGPAPSGPADAALDPGYACRGGARPGAAAPIALAFDHARILADGLDRARAKIEYSPLATAFLQHDFTIPELRAVYEAVWDEKLHPGNFHRKVLSVPGFVEGTGTTTKHGGARGGPRARTYRSGDARLLHPALLRPAREEEAGERIH